MTSFLLFVSSMSASFDQERVDDVGVPFSGSDLRGAAAGAVRLCHLLHVQAVPAGEHPERGGRTDYQCRTSEAVVERMSDWIETDECVRACGVSRDSVGISSDSLMESDFAQKLCSQPCKRNCPNIVDLYFNLAAGEGVFLPDLCEAQQVNPRRSMAQILSSGAAPSPAAPPPVSH
ncbi:PAR1 protein [Musa troglodytarum]|uniref:PAR1 protein n=1 Tax=Musa troglodytarum TaxID=320322 RepID=A0A9E7G5W4_9LILI|nr:PAR1 protein [Musa troglodytarum]